LSACRQAGIIHETEEFHRSIDDIEAGAVPLIFPAYDPQSPDVVDDKIRMAGISMIIIACFGIELPYPDAFLRIIT
jgi:hypothetical protein